MKVMLAMAIVGAFGCFYWLDASKQARITIEIQERKDAEEEHMAKMKAQYEADSQAREAYLATISDADLRNSGEQCVNAISSKMNTSTSLGWDYVDYDAYEFEGLKTNVVMGLKVTAYGAETSGTALVEAQVLMFKRIKDSIGYLDQFRFITSERRDSYSGIKQVLKLHVCRINGPNKVEEYEADAIVL